jgi:hypothetical protein
VQVLAYLLINMGCIPGQTVIVILPASDSKSVKMVRRLAVCLLLLTLIGFATAAGLYTFSMLPSRARIFRAALQNLFSRAYQKHSFYILQKVVLNVSLVQALITNT